MEDSKKGKSSEQTSACVRMLDAAQSEWFSYRAGIPPELGAERKRARAVQRIVKAALDAFVTDADGMLAHLEQSAKHALRVVSEKHFTKTGTYMFDAKKFRPQPGGWSLSLGDAFQEKGGPEPTLFSELRRLAWRFVPQLRPNASNYSEAERHNQKVARVLHELGSASAELLDALVAACDEPHSKYVLARDDTKTRRDLVDLLKNWDTSKAKTRLALTAEKNLALTERAMNLARDGLLELSSHPDWAFEDQLDPEEVKDNCKRLQTLSQSEHARTAGNRPETLAKELLRAMGLDPGKVDDMFSKLS